MHSCQKCVNGVILKFTFGSYVDAFYDFYYYSLLRQGWVFVEQMNYYGMFYYEAHVIKKKWCASALPKNENGIHPSFNFIEWEWWHVSLVRKKNTVAWTCENTTITKNLPKLFFTWKPGSAQKRNGHYGETENELLCIPTGNNA